MPCFTERPLRAKINAAYSLDGISMISPALFAPSLTGPFCQIDRCLEGKMTCGRKLQADMTPKDILEKDYPALWEGGCR